MVESRGEAPFRPVNRFFMCKGGRGGVYNDRSEEKPMKAIHFLLGLILYLAIAAFGLALIVSTRYPEFIQIAQGAAHGLPG